MPVLINSPGYGNFTYYSVTLATYLTLQTFGRMKGYTVLLNL